MDPCNEQLRYRYSASLMEVSGLQGAPVTGPNGAQSWLQHGPGFDDRRILTSSQGQQVPADGFYQKFELLRRQLYRTQADLHRMQGLLAELVPTQPGYYGTPSFPKHDASLPETNQGTAFSANYYVSAGPILPSDGHPPAWNTTFAQTSAPGPINTVSGPPAGAGNQEDSQASNVGPPPSAQGGLMEGPSTSAAATSGLPGSQQPASAPTSWHPPPPVPSSDNSSDAMSAHQRPLNARMEPQNQNLVGNQGLPVAHIRLHLGAGPSTSRQQGNAGIVVPQMYVHIKGLESPKIMGALPRDVPTPPPPTTRTRRLNTTSSRPAYVPYSTSEGTIAPLNSDADSDDDEFIVTSNQEVQEDDQQYVDYDQKYEKDAQKHEEDNEDDDKGYEDGDEQDTAPPQGTSHGIAKREAAPEDEYSKRIDFLPLGTSFGSINGNELGSYEVAENAATGNPSGQTSKATLPEETTSLKIENTQGLDEQPAGAPEGNEKKPVTASLLCKSARSLGRRHTYAGHCFGKDVSDRVKQEFREKGGVPCSFCETPILRRGDAYRGGGCQCRISVYHKKCTRALLSEFLLTGTWSACKRCGDTLLPKTPPRAEIDRSSKKRDLAEITARRLLRDIRRHHKLVVAQALSNSICH